MLCAHCVLLATAFLVLRRTWLFGLHTTGQPWINSRTGAELFLSQEILSPEGRWNIFPAAPSLGETRNYQYLARPGLPSQLWGRVMNWKLDLDALIESTMAFARDAGLHPVPDVPVAMKTVEQALADTPIPVEPPILRSSVIVMSEREEILQRVTSFKAHQTKVTREREDYYLQVRAKMTTSATIISPAKSRPA
jgi:hypothetical protein